MNADQSHASQRHDSEDDLALAELEEIDRLCSKFEEQLKSGRAGRMSDDFLNGRSGKRRTILLRELLAVELEYLRRHGGSPSKQEYLQRFPLDVDCVHVAFARLCNTETELTSRGSQTPAESGERESDFIPDAGICDLESALKQLDGLLDKEVANKVRQRLGGNDAEQPAEVLQQLVADGYLTGWQANVITRGGGEDRLILDEYVLLEIIGSGGMGRVFRARHRRMDREVAVKVLLPRVAADTEGGAQFLREVRAAARLTHPNIVQAFDAREEKGVRFLVMELVEGHTVSSLVREEGALTVGRAVALTIQAARALHCAHAAGIVHRDVKPGNLMVDKDDQVKLLDLGLAWLGGPKCDEQAEGESVEPIRVAGTIAYMAPEQFDPTNGIDGRADVFGLGATLYFMLTGSTIRSNSGRLPMSSQSPEFKNESSIDDLHEDIAPDFKSALWQMLAVSPDERLQTMTEVIAALTPFLPKTDSSGVNILSPVNSNLEADRTDRILTRWPLYTIAVSVLAACLYLSNLFFHAQREPNVISSAGMAQEDRPRSLDSADQHAIRALGGQSDVVLANWLLSAEMDGAVILERDPHHAVTRLQDLPAPPYRVIGAALKKFEEPLLIQACERLRRGGITQFHSGDNSMDNAALKHVAGIETLEYLWIDYCRVDDRGLPEIARLKNLKAVGLSGLSISGQGLSQLTELRGLREINLSGRLSAEDLRPLLKFPEIDWLGLTDSVVDESIADILVQIPKLKRLSLSESRVSAAALRRLAEHGELQHLFLTDAIVEAGAVKRFRERRPDIICDD